MVGRLRARQEKKHINNIFVNRYYWNKHNIESRINLKWKRLRHDERSCFAKGLPLKLHFFLRGVALVCN